MISDGRPVEEEGAEVHAKAPSSPRKRREEGASGDYHET